MLRQDCLSILKTNWVYERLTAGVVNDIIHEHNFSRLRHTLPEDFPVEKLASFAVMQLMLNLHNPQNKNPYKHELLEQFHADIQDHLSEYIYSINQLPQTNPELMEDHFYRKILRVANSVSSEEDKSRALFVLFGLLSILNKPTLYDKINKLRNKIFLVSEPLRLFIQAMISTALNTGQHSE
jgi:hypothetical protein